MFKLKSHTETKLLGIVIKLEQVAEAISYSKITINCFNMSESFFLFLKCDVDCIY